MAVKIIDPKTKNDKYTTYCACEILVDTEEEIAAFNKVVTDGRVKVIPTPGSMAYTADMSAVYQLSPSYIWTKVV